jgi:NAD(P)-dependent dehydrogenase (short-subunit alcohol dehydrogenase family)
MIHNRTMIEPKPAPSSSVGPVAWLRSNLFNGPINTIFTLIGLYILYLLVVPTVQWAFINADWVGTTRDDCSREGACWVFINARFTQFIYGLYPRSEIWRANIVFAGFFTLIAWLAIPRLPFKHWVAVFALVGFPVIAYVLLHGGYFDLPRVPTHRWGGLQSFTASYQAYFDDHADDSHQCLDLMPRFAVWRDKGMVLLAANQKRLQIVEDICRHTIKAIQWGEALGGWQALPRQDLFDVEYWELEQAKLKSSATRPEFEGKVVVVSGAASGIGRACVCRFLNQGAAVLALDIADSLASEFSNPAVLSVKCDLTQADAIASALQQGVLRFGGIDMLVSNAGNFPLSQNLEDMDDDEWEKSMALNLGSHMKLIRACLPYLKHGLDPSIVIVASKNVPAPGPGAAAYSAAKAGLTQLARVAALELGEAGIRVNVLHPNAVYDTAIWTDEVLSERAAHYNLSVEEYKTTNILKTEVKSTDVARAVTLFAGTTLAKTTGAQLAVDGGNERVI